MSAAHDDQPWVDQQRPLVLSYLHGISVDHLGLGEWPAFYIRPIFAIWAVQSKSRPGWVGWWAFSGDIPTDCVSRTNGNDDPRKALARLLDQWRRYIPHLELGNNPPDVNIGSGNSRIALAGLLTKRIYLLERWHKDDTIWQECL